MDLRQLGLHPYPQETAAAAKPQETAGAAERIPQWTLDETREFLAIRAQLDKSFTETKRNKPLWEATSSLLHQKGFFRTPDQCKSKWKNLVTRFKGSESVDQGEMGRQQFPFYEEMRRIFSDRMERLLVFEKEEKGKGVQVQVKEWDQEEEEEVEGMSKKRRKVAAERRKNKSVVEEEVEGALREFMRRQLEMEAQWLEAVEAREAERRAKEMEWRRVMEGLQEERMEMERRWREREEERRAREEARAERRHALIMALLNKLTQKDL